MNSMNLSTNSAKGSTLSGIGGIKPKDNTITKRMSVAPSLGAGGLGLKFNNNKKAKEPEEVSIEPQDEAGTSQVNK